MSAGQVAWLGAIAGATIFLGLPIGRVSTRLASTKVALNAVAVGILIFLLWDVLTHAWEPIDTALAARHAGPALLDGLVLAVGVAVGLVGLVWFDRWMSRRARPAGTTAVAAGTTAVTAGTTGTTGSAASTGAAGTSDDTADRVRTARRLALMIAIGIGLHNFAEGLAIGSSAASGELSFAWLLVIGFATHNATEGFGIVAPLTAEGIRPTWTQLLWLGLIGGGPTLIGTLVGQRTTAELAGIAFLALAAGSILYVVVELLAVLRRYSLKYVTTWGLFAGLMLGFLTDGILTAAGA